MRLIFVLILLFSLPVLVVAHRQYYSTSLQSELLARLTKALDAPEFDQVQPSLDYMDVTLKGRVPDLATREKAQQLADALPGLRCRQSDNLLQITPRLEGELAGRTLAISGWLHDELTLRNVTQWLAAARPGIGINTEGVRVSPHVTIEESPASGRVPASFLDAWTAIEVPSSLAITRSGSTFTLSGHLSAPSLHQAIVVALTDAISPEAVDAATLESGAFVRDAKFAVEGALPLFLKRFFVTPGAMKFTADQDRIHVAGHATPTMQREWLELLEPLSREATLDAQLQVFPSVYHFPGRVQESVIADEPYTILEDVLRASVINFDPGYTSARTAEQPKISAAADAILGAGPGAQIVVGGHVDLSGDPKNNLTMARRRAEGVVAELVSKGVPARVLESAVFEAVPGAEDHSRQVEFLIK